jgi:hypothetical protein
VQCNIFGNYQILVQEFVAEMATAVFLVMSSAFKNLVLLLENVSDPHGEEMWTKGMGHIPPTKAPSPTVSLPTALRVAARQVSNAA